VVSWGTDSSIQEVCHGRRFGGINPKTNPSCCQGKEVAERDPQTRKVVKEVDSSNHPVEQVSWEDAVEFCQRLSEMPEEKKAGRVYRLPTEAEWEYACRAGTKTVYSFGDDPKSLGDYAWFCSNSVKKTRLVGQKKPNAWGLYDTHGNVWEWCSDWYGDYPKGAVADAVGVVEGSRRVMRGACWHSGTAGLRSACRVGNHSSHLNGIDGFRVAPSPSGIPE
jgi:formylglycine-generating enzyme required for sulfatase activity